MGVSKNVTGFLSSESSHKLLHDPALILSDFWYKVSATSCDFLVF